MRMGVFESIFENISLKAVGIHLRNYANLFVKPVYVWKQVLSPRKTSYDLVVLHVIYYSLFLFLFLEEYKLAVLCAVLDVVMTCIPYLILLPSFLLVKQINNLHFHSYRLFRLCLILKIQIATILAPLYILNDKIKSDELTILFTNTPWVGVFLFIVVLPLLTKVSWIWRILWIGLNYIFLNVFCLTVYKTVPENIGSYVANTSHSPDNEYINFVLEYNDPFVVIEPRYMFVLMKDCNGNRLCFSQAQFVSKTLYLGFLIAETNESRRTLFKRDSTYKLKYKLYPKEEELTEKLLPKLREQLNEIFYTSLKMITKYKDSTKYSSNKNYFTLLYNRHKLYEKPFLDVTRTAELIETAKETRLISFNDSVIGVLIPNDTTKLGFLKQKIKTQEEYIENRMLKSSFLMRQFLYPFFWLIEKYE